MNLFKQKKLYISKRNLCSFFGHKMIITRKVTDHIQEYKCSNCELELTNNIYGHTISLTPELKKIHESINNWYRKKKMIP
jgi:hypothetical protein